MDKENLIEVFSAEGRRTFSAVKVSDAWADAANYCIAQYAATKGPDDPARVIREE